MTKEPTVKELRQAGYRVKVIHSRKWTKHAEPTPTHELKEMFQSLSDVEPKGGRTEVSLRDLDGNEFHGCAECSRNDVFVRKVGLKVALGRAIKDMKKFQEKAEVTKA